jgi:Predicted membrane protein (DUF2085)
MRESVPSGVLNTALRPAFVAATVTWALLLPLVPFVASRPHATPIAAALVIAVYAIGSAICHQLPERSYHLWTAQMPVCARCAGISAGAAIAAMLVSVAQRTPSVSRGETAARRRPDRVRAILLLAALPALATLAYEWTTGDIPAHWIRAATGVPLGATVASMILSSMPHRTRAENQVN